MVITSNVSCQVQCNIVVTTLVKYTKKRLSDSKKFLIKHAQSIKHKHGTITNNRFKKLIYKLCGLFTSFFPYSSSVSFKS